MTRTRSSSRAPSPEDTSLVPRAQAVAVGAEVALALAASGPLHSILAQCASALQRYLGSAVGVRVWTLDAAVYTLELRAAVGLDPGDPAPDRRVPVGRGSVGKVAQLRAPQVLQDASGAWEEPDLQWAWREGVRAWAGYPLMVEDRLSGVVALYGAHAFSPVLLEPMAIVGRAMAVGVERHHAEERLRRAELTFRSFFSSSLDAMVVARRGVVVAANAAAARLHGQDHPEDLMGTPVVSLLAPELRQDAGERLQRHAAGLTRDHAWEALGLRRDGSTFDLDVRISSYQVGGETYTLATLRDISTQKNAARELERSLSMLRATVDSTADGILVVDGAGRIQVYNQKFAQMWRIPKPALEGRDDRAVLALALPQVEDPESFQARVAELYTLPDAESFDIIPLRDGRVFERYSLPHRVGGKSLGRVWSFRDVTHSKTAERALRESEARFRRLYNHTPVMLQSVDEHGRLVNVSDYWLSALGYGRAEVLGRPFYDFLTEGSRHDALEQLERLCCGSCHDWPLQFAKKAGGKLEVLLSSLAEQDAAGRPAGSVAVLLDVTEHHRLEEQLRESHKMEAVGRLAGGIAHDFNNLLTAVAGYATLIQEGAREGQPLHQQAQHILHAADRAATLTNQLLAFSRRQVLQPRVLDVNQVLTDLERLLRPAIGEDITLVLRLEPALGAVRADGAQLEQAIMNLAANARDAMPEGGTLTVETANVRLDAAAARDAGLDSPGHYVKLAVRDTGRGMDEETRARIFEPFFSTKPRGQGTGLGLSTVYGVVQQSGGSIQVDSAPGQGATFVLYLPRVAEAAQQRGGPALSTMQVPGGTETILVVEDEDDVRSLIRASLAPKGYTVLEARHGAEALALVELRREPIHLLVTDVIMPTMGGRELAERVGPLRPEMKVLFISGYADGALAGRRPLEDGTEFLAKPFRPAALVHKVRSVLDAPRAR